MPQSNIWFKYIGIYLYNEIAYIYVNFVCQKHLLTSIFSVLDI